MIKWRKSKNYKTGYVSACRRFGIERMYEGHSEPTWVLWDCKAESLVSISLRNSKQRKQLPPVASLPLNS